MGGGCSGEVGGEAARLLWEVVGSQSVTLFAHILQAPRNILPTQCPSLPIRGNKGSLACIKPTGEELFKVVECFSRLANLLASSLWKDLSLQVSSFRVEEVANAPGPSPSIQPKSNAASMRVCSGHNFSKNCYCAAGYERRY